MGNFGKVGAQKLIQHFAFGFFLTSGALASVDPVPSEFEVDYTEALLAYQDNSPDECLQRLQPILEKNPNLMKALELRGLAYKAKGENKKSLSAFIKLRKLARKSGLPTADILPYEFQAATLLVQEKKFQKARPLFEKCVQFEFNTTLSKFYLGTIAMNAEEPREAQGYFRDVIQSKLEPIKPTAYFYLGLMAKRLNELTLAENNLKQAKTMADTIARNPASTPGEIQGAAQLSAAVDAVLNQKVESSGGAFFSSIGLVSGYDSNVLQNPSVDAGGTGQSTVTETLRYSLGYSWGSPNWQWVPLLQGSYNHNFADGSHAGQFWINDGSLYVTRNPKGPDSYGLRIGTNYIMRNVVADDSTETLTPQSLSYGVGPFYRSEWGKSRAWGVELYGQSNNFLNEASLSEAYRKTGYDAKLRFYYERNRHVSWWNPLMDLTTTYQFTSGDEFRSAGGKASWFNTIYFSDKTSLLTRASFGLSTYPDRSTGVRGDTELSAGITLSYRWKKWLKFSLESSYLNNASNVTSLYQYDRLSFGLGADWLL